MRYLWYAMFVYGMPCLFMVCHAYLWYAMFVYGMPCLFYVVRILGLRNPGKAVMMERADKKYG